MERRAKYFGSRLSTSARSGMHRVGQRRGGRDEKETHQDSVPDETLMMIKEHYVSISVVWDFAVKDAHS